MPIEKSIIRESESILKFMILLFVLLHIHCKNDNNEPGQSYIYICH